jgi:hypothetical protein
MSIKETGLVTPGYLETSRKTKHDINWQEIKNKIYSPSPKEKIVGYQLLQEISFDNLNKITLQKYYFYLGKYYHTSNFKATAMDNYGKSFLYATTDNNYNSATLPSKDITLEAKKAAINLSNIMDEKGGWQNQPIISLFDSQTDTCISKTINNEELLIFALDKKYPRAFYLFASHKNKVLINTHDKNSTEEHLKKFQETLKLLDIYFNLNKKQDRTYPTDALDHKHAKQLQSNTLTNISLIQESLKN